MRGCAPCSTEINRHSFIDTSKNINQKYNRYGNKIKVALSNRWDYILVVDFFLPLLLLSMTSLSFYYELIFSSAGGLSFPIFHFFLFLFSTNVMRTNRLRFVFIFHFITGATAVTVSAAAAAAAVSKYLCVCWTNVFSILSVWKIRTRKKNERKREREIETSIDKSNILSGNFFTQLQQRKYFFFSFF